MLTLYNSRGVRSESAAHAEGAVLPPDVVWIDLLKPEASETAFVETSTGLAMPSLDELSEIESSSRLRARDGALYLSAPLIFRPEPDQPLSTPVGFVLTRDRLITVRFAELPSFAIFPDRTIPPDSQPTTSAGIFTELLEGDCRPAGRRTRAQRERTRQPLAPAVSGRTGRTVQPTPLDSRSRP